MIYSLNDFRYVAYIRKDHKTFIHISHYQNETIQKQLLAVESFKSFQQQRNDSGLDVGEKVEMMELVGASYDIFNKKNMKATNREISEEFAKGNLEFSAKYLADDITWNILGDNPIIGKDQVLEVSKMLQLESFPIITIKNIVAEGDYVVVESKGEAKTKKGEPYNQTYCDVFRFNEGKLQEITTYLDTALSNESS